jgi:hypothetical protein
MYGPLYVHVYSKVTGCSSCCVVLRLFYEIVRLKLYGQAGQCSDNAFRLVFWSCLFHILAVVFNSFPQSLQADAR